MSIETKRLTATEPIIAGDLAFILGKIAGCIMASAGANPVTLAGWMHGVGEEQGTAFLELLDEASNGKRQT